MLLLGELRKGDRVTTSGYGMGTLLGWDKSGINALIQFDDYAPGTVLVPDIFIVPTVTTEIIHAFRVQRRRSG